MTELPKRRQELVADRAVRARSCPGDRPSDCQPSQDGWKSTNGTSLALHARPAAILKLVVMVQ